jgi:tight adherence protein C
MAICGFALAEFWLTRQVVLRQTKLGRSLPDFLDLMIVTLQSGLSVQGALRRVADELQLVHSVLASELSIVLREMELGATTDIALRRFADRSGCGDLRILGTFVHESQRFGTELVTAFRQHGETLRKKREQRAEERAHKAAVIILLPTLLLIFPALFVVVAGPAAIQIYTSLCGN